jgi:hypothetical protein
MLFRSFVPKAKLLALVVVAQLRVTLLMSEGSAACATQSGFEIALAGGLATMCFENRFCFFPSTITEQTNLSFFRRNQTPWTK